MANNDAVSSGGSGTVKSVGLSMPNIFAVANTPIVSSGVFGVTFNTQAPNLVFAGPAAGGSTAPGFRALVPADIPSLLSSKISDFNSATDARIVNAVGTVVQAHDADLDAIAALAPADGTFIRRTGGVWVGVALTASDIPALDTSKITTGTLAAARMPALTGDITTVAGAVATTLATVNASPGTYALATVTVNAKGLSTLVASALTTGSGNVVLATSPSIATPVITGGTIDNTSVGLTTPAGLQALYVLVPYTDASNGVINVLQLNRSTSATPAIGMGLGISFQGQSDTTASRNMAQLRTFWQTVTDASRKSNVVLSNFNGSTENDALWLGYRSDGTAVASINNIAPATNAGLIIQPPSSSVAMLVLQGLTSQSGATFQIKDVNANVTFQINAAGPTSSYIVDGLQNAVSTALQLIHTSTSTPGQNNNGVAMTFLARDATTPDVQMARIRALFLDVTHASYTSEMVLSVRNAAVEVDAVTILNTGVVSLKAGASTGTAKVGGAAFDHTTDIGNTTVLGADDNLYSDTIAASTLGTNADKITAYYGGIFVSSGTATRKIKVWFAGTAIFDTGALTVSLSAAWTIYVDIIRVSATVIRYMISLATEGAALSAYTAVGELTGLTLSNTNILKITGAAAGVGAAANDIVAKMASIGWCPAA